MGIDHSSAPSLHAHSGWAAGNQQEPRGASNLGGLLDNADSKPAQEPFLVVDLDLNAGFQVVDLPEIPPNRRLALIKQGVSSDPTGLLADASMRGKSCKRLLVVSLMGISLSWQGS